MSQNTSEDRPLFSRSECRALVPVQAPAEAPGRQSRRPAPGLRRPAGFLAQLLLAEDPRLQRRIGSAAQAAHARRGYAAAQAKMAVFAAHPVLVDRRG